MTKRSCAYVGSTDSAFTKNSSLLTRHGQRSRILFEHHGIQKTELVLALISALLCGASIPIDVNAEDASSNHKDFEVVSGDFGKFFEGNLEEKGPYWFTYVSGAPQRVGFINRFAFDDTTAGLDPITTPMKFTVKQNFPENYFGENSKQYFSLIGAYWAGNPTTTDSNFNYAQATVFKGHSLS